MGKFCFQHLPAGDVVGTVQLDLTVPAFNPAQTGPAAHNDQSDIVLVQTGNHARCGLAGCAVA